MKSEAWWKARDARLAWAYGLFGVGAWAAALWLGWLRDVAGSGWGLWALFGAGACALARAALAWPRGGRGWGSER